MSDKRMMPSETADSLCWMDDGQSKEGWTKVATQEGDDHRWWREMTEIVKDPDHALWAFDWKSGLTESQENEFPWENYNAPDDEETEVYSVRPVVKTVTEYVAA